MWASRLLALIYRWGDTGWGSFDANVELSRCVLCSGVTLPAVRLQLERHKSSLSGWSPSLCSIWKMTFFFNRRRRNVIKNVITSSAWQILTNQTPRPARGPALSVTWRVTLPPANLDSGAAVCCFFGGGCSSDIIVLCGVGWKLSFPKTMFLEDSLSSKPFDTFSREEDGVDVGCEVAYFQAVSKKKSSCEKKLFSHIRK